MPTMLNSSKRWVWGDCGEIREMKKVEKFSPGLDFEGLKITCSWVMIYPGDIGKQRSDTLCMCLRKFFSESSIKEVGTDEIVVQYGGISK